MTIPADAIVIDEPLDPTDRLDCFIALAQGPGDSNPPPFLLTGETVDSLKLAVTPEAAALGVRIITEGGYATTIDRRNVVTFWLMVEDDMKDSEIFDGAGVRTALVLTVTTNNVPPRRKQRTVVVTFRQR